jgi:hypothetical protein
MSIDQLVLHIPKGCSLWNIQTSSLGQHHLLVTPTQQKFQLSDKASDIIGELIDEEKSVAALAVNLSSKWKMQITPEDILAILDSVQWPKDLVARSYPWEPMQGVEENLAERKRSAALFGRFFFRATLIPARVVQILTKKLLWLYSWPTAVAGLLLAVVAQIQMFHQAVGGRVWQHPLSLSPLEYVGAFCLVGLTVVGHELGHATAATRCGINPGEIGFGLYLIYPALYTELGFAWLLPSIQRVLVDLGGFYFQFLATVPLCLGYQMTHSNAYLATVISLDFLMLFSLVPFFKFDGYWLVADVLGVPNLHKRSMEALIAPITVVKSRLFVSKNGMMFPRRIAVSLLIYGALFVPFQFLFAIIVLKNGLPILASTPTALYNLCTSVAASLAAGQIGDATYGILRLIMSFVIDLSLILIFRAYIKAAPSVWRFCFNIFREHRNKGLIPRLEGVQNDTQCDN